MWVRVDDEFTESLKVFAAAQRLGARSTARVLAVWLEALCWCNRKNTDGLLLREVVRAFRHDRHPLKVAEAMAAPLPNGKPGLLEACEGGWRVHDYHEYQPSAEHRAELSAKRAEAGRRGAAATNAKRHAGGKWPTLIGGNAPSNMPSNVLGNHVGKLPPVTDTDGGTLPEGCSATASPRYPVPDQDQNQDQDPRPPAGPRPVENRPPDDNPGAVRRLVHEFLECAEPHLTEADIKEHVKRRCAQLRIAYDSDTIRKALDNVQATRARREGAFA